MDYPREVLAPSGTKAWQGADGETYDTYEEAAAANIPKRQESALNVEPAAPSWANALIQLGMGLLISVYGPYLFLTDQLHLKVAWLEWLLPVGWFIIFGLALQGAYDVYLLSMRRPLDDGYRSDAVFEWWYGRVGCGLLVLIAAIVVLIFGWLGVQELFAGVSKGTAIISGLLSLILLALLARR